MATKQWCKSRSEHLASREAYQGSAWDTKDKQLVKASKEVRGRILPYMTMKEIDNAENMKQYKPEDFMLENLIEIGADKTLQMTINQLSTLQQVDYMEDGAGIMLDRMDAEEWAQKYLDTKNENKEDDK